jgi:ubiquitin-conjugating enzyme E2 Z
MASKRLPKEIADAHALSASGIYYIHDEIDMRKGRAMIIGPEGTPYAYCPLVFEFEFPSDYPFSSPAVRFITSDGATRFHPNLYVNGKVCLSILGTWSGPKWGAVMTISTVLMSIQSLLEANPIVNEPGWESYTLENPKARDYADYVQHALIAYSFRALLNCKRGVMLPEWVAFKDILHERCEDLILQLGKIIDEKAVQDERNYSVVYSMQGRTIWKNLAAAWEAVKLSPTTL